jgi:hypothetical protein
MTNPIKYPCVVGSSGHELFRVAWNEEQLKNAIKDLIETDAIPLDEIDVFEPANRKITITIEVE